MVATAFLAVAIGGFVWLKASDRAPLREANRRLAAQRVAAAAPAMDESTDYDSTAPATAKKPVRKLRVEHWMALGFRQAATASVLIGLAGVLSFPVWGHRGPCGTGHFAGDGGDDRFRVRALSGKAFAMGVMAAVALGAVWRVPRLTHSFWNDEAYVARIYIWGSHILQPDGALRFVPVSWKTALFWNEHGNNHVWCSLEAKGALSLWQWVTGTPQDVFNEAVMRLPALLWGLAGVGVIALLGRRVGGSLTGLAAALILALHPWHVRYAVELRGYSVMLLALTLGLICVLRALDDGGRWRWWLASAAMNLWALLAFSGCVWFVAGTTALAFVELVRRRSATEIWRLLLSNLLAAVIFAWIFSPSVPQLMRYLRGGSTVGSYQHYLMGWSWALNLWTCLTSGTDWNSTDIGLMKLAGGRWWLAAAPVAAATAVIGWGTIRALTGPRAMRFVALTTAIGFSGTILQCWLSDSPTTIWYLLPALVGIVVLAAIGLADIVSAPRRHPWVAALTAAGLLLWIGVPWGARRAMARVDRHPMRQPTEWVRENRPRALTGVFGVSDRQLLLYDPGVDILRTTEDLTQLEARAAEAGRPLVIYQGGIEEGGRRFPELAARMQEAAGYRVVGQWRGLEEMFSYIVYENATPSPAPAAP